MRKYNKISQSGFLLFFELSLKSALGLKSEPGSCIIPYSQAPRKGQGGEALPGFF